MFGNIFRVKHIQFQSLKQEKVKLICCAVTARADMGRRLDCSDPRRRKLGMTQIEELLAAIQQHNIEDSLEELSPAASHTEKDPNALSLVPDSLKMSNEGTMARECL